MVVAQVKTDDNGAMVETVEYLFDYASPWAYLADRMLANDSYTIAQGVDVSFRPIYLRGLEMFNKGLPYSSRKLAYIAQDLTRCTSFLGIEFSFPEVFPVNGLYALRAALAAQRRGVTVATCPIPRRFSRWSRGRAWTRRSSVRAWSTTPSNSS